MVLHNYTRPCPKCGADMHMMRKLFTKTMEQFHVIFICNRCKVGKLIHKGTLHGEMGGVERTVYDYECDVCGKNRTYDQRLNDYETEYDI